MPEMNVEAYRLVREFMELRGYKLTDERYHEILGLLYDFATEAIRRPGGG